MEISANRRLFRIAFLLSLFTIAVNVLEGFVSIHFGSRGEE